MAEEQREHLEFDLATIPPEARFRAWCAAFPFYDLSTPDPLRFEGRGRSWSFPPLVVSDVQFSPVHYVRTLERIQVDQKDDVTMQLVVSGRGVGRAGGHEFVVRSGDISFQDMARPLEVAVGSIHLIATAIPRTFLEEAIPGADVHGLVLRSGMAKLLRAFLTALPDTLDSASDKERMEIARLLRDLVAATLRQEVRSGDAQGTSETALRNRARRYIARHLVGALDVASLCVALGASRSNLYRAFEREGGIVSYVQRRRLARLYRLFSDPAERRSISQLAALHGFGDLSHFSHLFRRTFGCSPRALRQGAARAASPPKEGSPQLRFRRWRERDD